MTQTIELLPLPQETTLLLDIIHSVSTSLIEAKLVHPQIFVGLNSHLLDHMMSGPQHVCHFLIPCCYERALINVWDQCGTLWAPRYFRCF